MIRKYTKRIPDFVKPTLEEYESGDEAFWLPAANDDLPNEEIPHDKMDKMWNELYYWILEIIRKHKRRKESLEYTYGNEILPYVESRDAFGIRFSIKYAGKDFNKAFQVDDMPQEAKELLEILMYEPPKYFDLVMQEDGYFDNKYFGIEKANEAIYGPIFS